MIVSANGMGVWSDIETKSLPQPENWNERFHHPD